MDFTAIQFIDSHLHLDNVAEEHPGRIAWLAAALCLPISWAFSRNVPTRDALAAYLGNQAAAIKKINTDGLACFYLSGIHPRNITPDLLPEDIPGLLLPFVDDPLCLGIGEIGLEDGSAREREMLASQLALAPEVVKRGKVLGLHTPRNNKSAITREILGLLEPYGEFRDHMVVDHCSTETIGLVLESGLWAGVTLNSAKTSALELNRMLAAYALRSGRLLLNTDSGTEFHEDLAAYHQSSCGISYPTARKITRDNALAFFGLQSSAAALENV